jgi:hypothetical protein
LVKEPKKTKNALTLLALSALATLLCAPAQADFMNYNGMGLSEVVRLHAAGTLANNLSVYAGQNRLTFAGNDVLGYCVDINQYSGSGNVTVDSVASLPHGNDIAYLLNTYAPAVATNHDAAVLAVAIWEVLSETSSTFSATSGYFSISDNASVAADANTMLAAIPANYQPSVWPAVLHSDSIQDMAILTYAPEPASLALLAVGGLAMMRKKGRA